MFGRKRFVELVKETDVDYEEELRMKVAEAERLLSENGNKRKPPYEITINVTAMTWKQALAEVASCMDHLMKGPDCGFTASASTARCRHSVKIESGPGVDMRWAQAD